MKHGEEVGELQLLKETEAKHESAKGKLKSHRYTEFLKGELKSHRYTEFLKGEMKSHGYTSPSRERGHLKRLFPDQQLALQLHAEEQVLAALRLDAEAVLPLVQKSAIRGMIFLKLSAPGLPAMKKKLLAPSERASARHSH
ncbi:hypothetical protein EYF80_024852 [Liparis tanakae]|uniref:Uncharacterized protein n=1 Tax=Liparis tanakae TaxID=230148 RepID=A0A4Z2HGG1_9TELE|nr:hypothetical protein EYF80_024852 [Liparis tanakae]